MSDTNTICRGRLGHRVRLERRLRRGRPAGLGHPVTRLLVHPSNRPVAALLRDLWGSSYCGRPERRAGPRPGTRGRSAQCTNDQAKNAIHRAIMITTDTTWMTAFSATCLPARVRVRLGFSFPGTVRLVPKPPRTTRRVN